MLELGFWDWLFFILFVWLVMSVPIGLFIGRVCALNNWDLDEDE